MLEPLEIFRLTYGSQQRKDMMMIPMTMMMMWNARPDKRHGRQGPNEQFGLNDTTGANEQFALNRVERSLMVR